jgi:hypothetical protein
MAEQQRCAIELWVRLGKSGSETLQFIHQAYGDDAMRRAAVFKWWKRFRDGETTVKNESRSGRPSTAPVPLSYWSLRQTVCSMFSRSGWSVVRRASLSRRGTSKKRPSPHLHKVPTRSNKGRPRTLQTALIYTYVKAERLHETWYQHNATGGHRPFKTSMRTLRSDQHQHNLMQVWNLYHTQHCRFMQHFLETSR